MSVKNLLESLVLEKAPGPSPSFTIFDVIKVFETIAEAASIGRGRLSSRLGLGEGATRTLLSRLLDANLISISKSGCSLTDRGKKFWNTFKMILPRKAELEKNEFTIAAYDIAVLIKNRGQKIGKGLEQRDAAVKAGAKGATTLVFKGNRLVLPTISADIKEDYPKAFRQITRLMGLEENDVVIISSADLLKQAEYGALAAAWTII